MTGEAELAAASTRVASLAAAPAGGGQHQDAAMDAANLAVNSARQKIAEGTALMEQATQQELQANQAATTQVQSAQGQLAGMTAPVPGAAGGAPGGGTADAPGAPLGAPPEFVRVHLQVHLVLAEQGRRPFDAFGRRVSKVGPSEDRGRHRTCGDIDR